MFYDFCHIETSLCLFVKKTKGPQGMKWQNRCLCLCLCQDQVAMLTHVEDSEMETNSPKYCYSYRCLGEQRESKNTGPVQVIFIQNKKKAGQQNTQKVSRVEHFRCGPCSDALQPTLKF